MVLFNFEEMELINNFFEDKAGQELTREFVILTLVNAIENTEDKELVNIAESTVAKIRKLDDKELTELLHAVPLDMLSQEIKAHA